MLTEKLSRQSRAFVETAEQIAQEVVEPLAETWDRETRFPHELFAALHTKQPRLSMTPVALR
jgi:hypothetical protein